MEKHLDFKNLCQYNYAMNIEFHYYILHILLLKAGFNETDAYTVAYSSQFVDDSIIAQTITLPENEYHGIITQNYGWWGDWYPKNVYIPFHFFPGDIDYSPAQRKDGRANMYNTTPGSVQVVELLQEAFKTGNLYRIGIALHTYADSWAHQNFSGLNEEWNEIKATLIPNVGHAEVLNAPDIITNTWNDPRLLPEYENINNRQRFLEAAKNIYEKLCSYTGKSPANADSVIMQIDHLVGSDENSALRIKERIYDYILAEDLMEYNRHEWLEQALHYNAHDIFSLEELDEYNALEWIKDSILYSGALHKRPRLLPKPDFYTSHWYQWNEAAKAHLECARKILNGLIGRETG